MGKRTRMLATGVALIVSLAALGFALSTLRGGHRTNGDYALFADCPLRNPRTNLCLITQTVGGEFVVGSKKVPLSRTITLQGGVHLVENSEKAIVKDELIAAVGDETLSKASQAVPGGLREVVDSSLLAPAPRKVFDELLATGRDAVTATIELAGPASSIGVSTQNLIEARGIGLSLPLKVKLSNPFLGESCYIGSNAHPIVIALTTGRTDTTSLSPPHESLAGKPGHASFEDNYNLVTISEESLVSDSFAAPRAEGCGGTLTSEVVSAVNAKLGLPAAAGGNQTILDVTLRDANAPAVLG